MKVIAVLGLLFAPIILGALLGIVPGLLFGIPGWHKAAAIVLAVIWAGGYINQRGKSYNDVDGITFVIAIGGALGLAASVWLFGSFTD